MGSPAGICSEAGQDGRLISVLKPNIRDTLINNLT